MFLAISAIYFVTYTLISGSPLVETKGGSTKSCCLTIGSTVSFNSAFEIAKLYKTSV